MEKLDVYMNGIKVGEYTRTRSGANQFTYDKSWLVSPGRRSISMSLPLQSTRYDGPEVYNYFDNLIPDSREIRDRIVARFQANSTEPFDILAQIGRDCVGAIQLVPQHSPAPDIKHIEASPLTDEQVGRILRGYQSKTPLGMLKDQRDFRISLAGAQEKTALLFHDGQWHLPHNATPTNYIIKLPIGEIQSHDRVIDMKHSVENEYLCLKIAKAYGFDTANCEIIAPDGMKALAVERFDRKLSADGSWIMRLPQEDFCQVTGTSPARKYETDGGPAIATIMKELLGSGNPMEDRHVFMRAQVLFWLLGATDGHAKNFSIFIGRGSQYRLTPLYDILSAFPAISKRGLHEKDLKLAMSLKGSRGRKYECRMIRREHFLATAKDVGFSEDSMNGILDEMAARTEDVIQKVASELPATFPGFIADPIFDGMRRHAQRLAR
ncbi:type II toxin-antitoxin system HipA family toxin [Pseudidiomarina halophila]|uniref:Serine/threonine protein kinase n=1 Tax=Pseudidiomarina halophila TaxID=1449799 RepID=A0A432XW13_9GAMM|nr:type II toxin-antitoxin system HipA family toxin [Pseudidiomarina halophila]RUO52804.1 serine/threonine protein kinase [Pseudidiomarina halophila]